jgi:hypothetical protein
LDRVSDFVQHLHARAFPQGRQYSSSQARDEAVALLEQAYHGAFATGHEAALADATKPAYAGLAQVLLAVAQIVKTRERSRYIRWILARHIDPSDWRMNCALAQVLLDRCRGRLPARLQSCQPEYLVDDLPELLAVSLAAGPGGFDWAGKPKPPPD